MSGSLALFRFVAKAALNYVGFGVAGDFVGEALPDIARALYDRWVKGRPAALVHAEVVALAQVNDDQARRMATQAVAELVPQPPASIHLALVTYLAQLPASIRRTQRSPRDPSGKTVSAELVLGRPADVLALLPPRAPRFQKGQPAQGFPDWTLTELLGIGGFGEVCKATNPHLPPVALKYCLDETAARYLRHEAGLLGRIVRQGRHPGLVALLDTALSTTPPCLKYEYVAGGDLTGLLRNWREQPQCEVPLARRVRAVVRQIAEAVAFAHRLSPPIVHRDLKPGNVLVQYDAMGEPTVQVADFGIGAIVTAGTFASGLTSLHGSTPTALRSACTPLYASPQQLRGDDPTPADDVFALGVLWYQMLAEDLTQRPGTDWREVLASSCIELAELDLLGRCLSGRADRRLPDAGTLLDGMDALEENGKATEKVVPGRFDPEFERLIEGDQEDAVDDQEDDPQDLAERLQQSLVAAQRGLAEAPNLAEKRHDYAAAVRRLERLPQAFCDLGLLSAYRNRRDRIHELRQIIHPAAKAGRFAGLRDRIEDLLALTPNDAKYQKLLKVVPYQPGLEIVNSVEMELTLIQAGRFTMGSPVHELGHQACEGPTHEVEITRPFYLGTFPVTQEQYERVMQVNPARFSYIPGMDTRRFPVENVRWEEAVAFCQRLSSLPSEREKRRRYRLPTEAEWEYACRAGGEVSLPFSHGRVLESSQANFDGRHPYGHAAYKEYRQRPTVVGSFAPNAWGLFDLHGNVWEWCSDWYSEARYPPGRRVNPTGAPRGEAKILRGGSWQNHGRLCRSANRDWIGPEYRSFTVGFRVVLEVG